MCFSWIQAFKLMGKNIKQDCNYRLCHLQLKYQGLDTEIRSRKNLHVIHLSLSKLWQIYEKYRDDFPSAEEFVNWYNNRPMIRGGRSVVSPNSLMRDEVESEDRLYANNVTK